MRVLFLCVVAGVLGTFASAQTRLYVVNGDGSRITIIDLAAGKVAGEVAVSPGPVAVVASEGGRRLYVSSGGGNVVDVVDRRTLKVTKSIPVGLKPAGMVLAPNGRFLFVCIRGGASVEVIDTASLMRTKSIPVGVAPGNIYVTPDGTRLIVTSEGDKKLVVINVRSQVPEFEIPAGGVPLGLAFESDRNLVIRRLFVQVPGSFGIIDYATRKTAGKFTPPGARGLAVSPDRRTAWVSHSPGDAVTVFGLPDLKKLETVAVGAGMNPGSMVFAADGKRVYVANTDSNDVSVIDTATYKELMRIPAGMKPGRIFVE